MKKQNINRGNESIEHRAAKQLVAEILYKAGFKLVFYEKYCCDVIAVKPATKNTFPLGCDMELFTLGCEVELSIRNLMSNINRDLHKLGCNGVLIIAPNFSVLAEIARKLDRELPPDLREKVGITTLSALRMIAP
jgi:hypothetical protein